MTHSNILRLQFPAGLLILALVSMSQLIGCQTYKYESRLLKRFEKKGNEYTMSATELRLEMNDLASVFRGTRSKK